MDHMHFPESLVTEKSRKILNIPSSTSLCLQPILKGGSDRCFYRLVDGASTRAIVMHYSQERQENEYYASIGFFLKRLGIQVPEILVYDAENRLVWLEYLGEIDLHALNDKPWSERRPAYEKTLRQVHRLHAQGWTAWNQQSPIPPLMHGFDHTLYTWEQNYFLEQFVEAVCHKMLSPTVRDALAAEWRGLVERLQQHPVCLVHRDLQSQNIMLRGGEPYLIDFQGMRFGTSFYDLGSLLFDPYVSWTESEQNELLRFYYDLAPSGLNWNDFQRAFFEAASQRLMQALGAYGFLGLKKGKKQFLNHIPAGLRNLRQAVRQAGSLPILENLVQDLHPSVSSSEIKLELATL